MRRIYLVALFVCSQVFAFDLANTVPGVVENGKIVWYLGSPSQNLGQDGSLRFVQRCIDYISDTPGSTLRFTYGGTTTEDKSNAVHNVIMFSNSANPLDSSTYGLTVPKGNGFVVIINDSITLNRALTQHVILHEIGHMIGLTHSPDTASIMYDYSGVGSQPYMTPSDWKQIIGVYPDKFYTGPGPDAIDYPVTKDPRIEKVGPAVQILCGDHKYVSAIVTFCLDSNVVTGSATWNYGDGTTEAVNTAVRKSAEHQFNVLGTYTITLSIVATEDFQHYKSAVTLYVDNSSGGSNGTGSVAAPTVFLKMTAKCKNGLVTFKLSGKCTNFSVDLVTINDKAAVGSIRNNKKGFTATVAVQDDGKQVFKVELSGVRSGQNTVATNNVSLTIKKNKNGWTGK